MCVRSWAFIAAACTGPSVYLLERRKGKLGTKSQVPSEELSFCLLTFLDSRVTAASPLHQEGPDKVRARDTS